MKPLIAQFFRVFLWCWLPVFALITIMLVALAVRGEMADLSRLNTWAALAAATFFAAVWAILPALFFAALFSAVLYKRSQTLVVVGGVEPSRSELSHDPQRSA